MMMLLFHRSIKSIRYTRLATKALKTAYTGQLLGAIDSGLGSRRLQLLAMAKPSRMPILYISHFNF
jgi:hypothetical protein